MSSAAGDECGRCRKPCYAFTDVQRAVAVAAVADNLHAQFHLAASQAEMSAQAAACNAQLTALNEKAATERQVVNLLSAVAVDAASGSITDNPAGLVTTP